MGLGFRARELGYACKYTNICVRVCVTHTHTHTHMYNLFADLDSYGDFVRKFLALGACAQPCLSKTKSERERARALEREGERERARARARERGRESARARARRAQEWCGLDSVCQRACTRMRESTRACMRT